ncbi:unnamed protein product [Paramecium sonneborni]|uniref:Uncharacterized protein n=1 Tax=Paramecium sonneborni TaxID=65129 RepID=A0A8S1RC80_9CILI|nr:unnamed protein product [Paramecium sonneborni]
MTSEKLLNIERRQRQLNQDYDSIISEENKKLKNELKLLQKQQQVIQAQLNIHTQIYLLICKQIKNVYDYLKQDEDNEEECRIFFESIIQIFKGFNHDIAQNIFEELKNIGGPLSPQPSPILFPYLKFN